MLPCTEPSTTNRSRQHLRLDLGVRPDRQDILAELNLAFDLALDGQILAAAQLTFDDHAFPDIHDGLLLLHGLHGFNAGGGGLMHHRRRRRRRRNDRLWRPGRFFTLPHVVTPSAKKPRFDNCLLLYRH
jgi:hypothetical protein